MKYLIVLLSLLAACKVADKPEQSDLNSPYLLILGTSQDAGYPHIACQRNCCKGVKDGEPVSCLAVLDPGTKKYWLFDATPDMPKQLKFVESRAYDPLPDGIFLTHAHIGHYTGLMYLGIEAVGSKSVPVYAMPRMLNYLSENGPWSQLVNYNNIELRGLQADSAVKLGSGILVEAFRVPHRDEFSETVGYKISGPNRSALYIPDIDKWTQWDRAIVEEIKEVDYIFVDATFFADGELPGRDMSKIKHPFVAESMELFKDLSESEKARIYFIHFNHTNPLLDPLSKASKAVLEAGFRIARQGQLLPL